MRDTDWAYLAGIIDGEGSIFLSKNNGGKSVQPHVVVAMSTPQPIKWVYRTFGGHYKRRWMEARGISPEGYRYTWGFHSQEGTYLICLGMLPYLKLKRSKAKEVIRYFEGKQQQNSHMA